MPLIPESASSEKRDKVKNRLEGRLGTKMVRTVRKTGEQNQPKKTDEKSQSKKTGENNQTKKTIKNIWAPKRTVNVNVNIEKGAENDDIRDEIANLLEERQKRDGGGNSSTEEGEINSEDQQEKDVEGTPGTDTEDDDLDLSTLVKLRQTPASFNQQINDQEEEEEDDDVSETDDLMYSPVDPIAQLPFITDFIPDYVPETVREPSNEENQRAYLQMKIRHQEALLNCLEESPVDTPSEGPATPDSPLVEEDDHQDYDEMEDPIELEEVNWESFNQKKYFRPIRGRNQFFRDRPGMFW